MIILLRLSKGIENIRNEKQESIHQDDILNQYQFMHALILSGRLPCTKDEASTLGAIQLRIYEIAFQRKCEEEQNDKTSETQERTERGEDEADAGNEADASKEITSDDDSAGSDGPVEAPGQFMAANTELKKLNLIEEAAEIDSETSSNASTDRYLEFFLRIFFASFSNLFRSPPTNRVILIFISL